MIGASEDRDDAIVVAMNGVIGSSRGGEFWKEVAVDLPSRKFHVTLEVYEYAGINSDVSQVSPEWCVEVVPYGGTRRLGYKT